MKLTRNTLAAAALAATASLAGAQSAQANSALFDFTAGHDGNLHSSLTFSDSGSGIDITATATSTQGNGGPWNDKVGYYSPGLGAKYQGDSSHTVDGKGRAQTLWLTADEDVAWSYAGFGYVGHVQNATNKVDVVDGSGSLLQQFDLDTDSFNISLHGQYFDVIDLGSLGYTGTTLGLRAPGGGDSWKVAGVQVDSVPPAVSSVPTPSAALAGLGMLGAYAIRRRRATRV